MRKSLFAIGLVCCMSIGLHAGTPTFNTFVSSSSINAVETQNQTIAFTYAGNKFVGSVYTGTNNNQLYQTDLTGGSVMKFSTPIPGASGEVVLGASQNLGGFSPGDIYAGSEANGQICKISNAGAPPVPFATLPVNTGGIRGIQFDTGGKFGGDMLITTNAGYIFRVTSVGVVTQLTHIAGLDLEGMDIATGAWGTFAGQLLVGSETGPGYLNLVDSAGNVTFVANVPVAETVSFVPLNLGSSGNPLEGFYVANFPTDIQFADASQFTGLLGDAIITSEDGGNSRLWDLSYNGTSFSVTPLSGTLPGQSEDGIFVTADRIVHTSVPEPGTLLLLGAGIGIVGVVRRKIQK
jgi:hypothetical protein